MAASEREREARGLNAGAKKTRGQRAATDDDDDEAEIKSTGKRRVSALFSSARALLPLYI